MRPPRTRVQDAPVAELREQIRQAGWIGQAECLHSRPDAGPYEFTLGVGVSVPGAPELLLLGVSVQLSHALLWCAVRALRGGLQIADGLRSAEVLEGYEVVFRAVQPSWAAFLIPDRPGLYARLGEAVPPLFAVVLPDRAGRFPWEDGYDAGSGAGQLEVWTALPAAVQA